MVLGLIDFKQNFIGHFNVVNQLSPSSFIQSVSIKTPHFRETKTSGTSYSETTNLLGLRLWLQGVLMSTPCCQISTSNRLVVSEYEVPKVLVSRKWGVFY